MEHPLDPVSEPSPSVSGHEPCVSPLASVPRKHASRLFRFLVLIVVSVLVLGSAAAVTAATYLLPPTDPLVRRVTSVVPYPVAVVNGQPISFYDFYAEQDALTHFFENNDLSDEQGAPDPAVLQTQILDTLIDKAAVQQLAELHHIALDQGQIDQFLQTAYEQSGSEEAFLEQVKTTFGWDKEQFVDHVIRPIVLAGQLRQAIESDADLQKDMKDKIETAAARLKNGEDFAAVAGDVSEDASASAGGDIGYVKQTEIPDAWASALSSLEPNTPSGIIELPEAFTIIKMSDRTATGEDTQYKLQIIVISKQPLDQVVDAFIQSSKVWRLLRTSS